MAEFQDLTGQRFGKLTVVERAPNKNGKTRYLCKCDCGNTIEVSATHLKDGHTISCGCLGSQLASARIKERYTRGPAATHGKSSSPIYDSYYDMVSKCTNRYRNEYMGKYADQGITICPEWYDPNYSGAGVDVDLFRNFYNWSMINGYEKGKTLDRIDINGPYAPWNCRWIDSKEQTNHRESNHTITFNGDQGTIAQFAEALGFNYDWYYTIMRRNSFNPYVVMRQVDTPYGFPVMAPFTARGQQVPMHCIYFLDQYGRPVSESQYVPPAPTPALWACDDKGFITGPMLD